MSWTPTKVSGANYFAVATGGLVIASGDVTGDGIDDVVISVAERRYLLAGALDGFSPNLTLDDLVEIDPIPAPPPPVFDFNGDGSPDSVAESPTGTVRLTLGGGPGAPQREIEIAFTGSNFTAEMQFSGPFNQAFEGQYPWSPVFVGDVNNDGFDDIHVGAPNVDFGNTAFIIFGAAKNLPQVIGTSDLDGLNGYSVTAYNYYLSMAASPLGDINGDGVDDFMLGAFFPVATGSDTQSGQATIILGTKSSSRFTLPVESYATDLPNSGYDPVEGGFREARVPDLPAPDLDKVRTLFSHVFPTEDADIDGAFFRSYPKAGSVGDINADGVGDYFLQFGDDQTFVVFGEASPSPEAHTQSISVRAGGTGSQDFGQGDFDMPAFSLLVDGQLAGERVVFVASNPVAAKRGEIDYQTHIFVYESDVAPERISIVYNNDGRTAESRIDKNLYIDNIIVNGVKLESETDGHFTRANGSTVGAGPREALYWNGTLSFDAPQAVASPDRIVVEAGGTGGPGLAPRFQVFADGELIGEASVSDPITNAARRTAGVEFESFVFSVDAARDVSEVEIRFVNDGRDPVTREDVNLFVRSVTLGADTLYAASDSRFFLPGDPDADLGAREALWWNGSLAFDFA